MRYDLVLSDFDGTLLRRDDTISARTVQAIHAYTAAGGVFGVSTGRAYTSIVQRLGELGLRGNFPVLSLQGTLVRDSESGAILSQTPMSRASVLEFIRRADALGLMSQFYTADDIFVPRLCEDNAPYFRINRLTPTSVGDLHAFVEKFDGAILKVLCLLPRERREEVLTAMRGIEGVKVFASHPMLAEAVSERAGKGNGLLGTCKRLGIDPASTAAIGDELNDVEMLQAAGLGVAMGNAVPACKQAADCITDDCDDDGVAKVLERIVRGDPFTK